MNKKGSGKGSPSTSKEWRVFAIKLTGVLSEMVEDHVVETRRRKQLRPNPFAPWELRVRSMRVFYEVTIDDPGIVTVLAIGIKVGNRLYIEDQEIKL